MMTVVSSKATDFLCGCLKRRLSARLRHNTSVVSALCFLLFAVSSELTGGLKLLQEITELLTETQSGLTSHI